MGASGAGSGPDPASGFSSPSAPAAAGGMTDNVAAALCYVLGLITGILFLVLAPYNQNRNIRFHAFQAIFFHVAVIVLAIVFTVVATILAAIPVLGFIIDMLLWLVFGFGSLAAWLFLMYKAYNNQKLVLPVIGPLAEKQA